MSNQLPDEEMRLRRNIEILGGIERTIPSKKSLIMLIFIEFMIF